MKKALIAPSTIDIRRSQERGQTDYDWLDSRHTFSFADYYDPAHMGYRSLRVINEDRVKPSKGFGPHSHRDMEILTYVIKGALKHRDSMGHETILAQGSIQKITAGSGIVHSELNASDEEAVHFLQIWIVPDRKGLSPSYAERILPPPDFQKPLYMIGSSDGEAGSIIFHQDVCIFRGTLKKGQAMSYLMALNRGSWLQMISGSLSASGNILHSGDGAMIEGGGQLGLLALADSEFLLFDLA